MKFLEIRDAVAIVVRLDCDPDVFDFEFVEEELQASKAILNPRKVLVKFNGYRLLYLRGEGYSWICEFENHMTQGLYESLGAAVKNTPI